MSNTYIEKFGKIENTIMGFRHFIFLFRYS